MNVSEAIAEYLLSQQANGSSLATVKWYTHMLKCMDLWASRPISEITTHDIRDLLASRRLKLAPASFKSLSTALHAFWSWAAREYLRAGGDVVTLARLMGHSDINTTAAYYGVFSEDELAEMHNRRSPLSSLFEK